MPSPIGHALAGVATAWAADLVPGRPRGRVGTGRSPWFEAAGGWLPVICAALAAAPDLDLAWGYHRTATHSFGAVLVVALAAWAIAVRAGRAGVRMGVICGAAYATHLLLDWLAVDRAYPYGIALLWPFSLQAYISGWPVFPGTDRRDLLGAAAIRHNAVAAAREVITLGPVVLGLWLVRVKALAGFATELPGSDHPTE